MTLARARLLCITSTSTSTSARLARSRPSAPQTANRLRSKATDNQPTAAHLPSSSKGMGNSTRLQLNRAAMEAEAMEHPRRRVGTSSCASGSARSTSTARDRSASLS